VRRNELKKNYNIKYVEFDFRKGYPSSNNLYYECQKCFDLVSSVTKENVECSCGNIFIDVSSARFVEKDSKIKLVQLTQIKKGKVPLKLPNVIESKESG
jgi:hypothetical protein